MDPPPPIVGVPTPEPPPGKPQGRAVVLVVAVGIVAGLLGYLAGATLSTDDDTAPQDAGSSVGTAPSTIPAPTSPEGTRSPPTTGEPSTSLPDQPLLGDLVPGFTGTLLLAVGDWPNFDMTEWRSDRAIPDTTALPPTVSLATDVTGRLHAGLGRSANEESDSVLYVGPVLSIRPAALKVTSLAWNNSIAGRLAWLQQVDEDGLELRVGEVDPPSGSFTPGTTIALIPADHRLLTWDSWGFLLNGPDPVLGTEVVYLVDADGSEQWRFPAYSGYASSVGQLLLMRFLEETGDSQFFLTFPSRSAEEEPNSLEWAPADPRGEVNAVAWSPDANHLAFLVYEGGATSWRIEVRQIDGTLTGSAQVPYRLWDINWTSDGRFVLATGTDNAGKFVVVFYDTVDESLDEVAFDTAVQQILTHRD